MVSILTMKTSNLNITVLAGYVWQILAQIQTDLNFI